MKCGTGSHVPQIINTLIGSSGSHTAPLSGQNLKL